MVYDLVVNKRENVFFTGSAGTGKSLLLLKIIMALKNIYGVEKIAVTATTGIAAVNITGTTLHSFAGIGLGTESTKELIKKIKKSKIHRFQWQTIEALIIDEVSMLDGDLFDKLEAIAQAIRDNNRPFGGILLIVTGDFFQLPPVSKDRNVKFCYESNSWGKCIKHIIQLSTVFRQKESDLIDMLNEIRLGIVTEKTLKIMNRLKLSPQYPNDGIQATELYSRVDKVTSANLVLLSKIQNKSYIYHAKDYEPTKIGQLKTLIKGCLAPDKLELKRGAQVMLIKNINRDLVNGSRGIVVGFYSDATRKSYYDGEDEIMEFDQRDEILPIVRFTENRELVVREAEWRLETVGNVVLASRRQIPLILAWAISIHKSQGQTLERVKIDLKEDKHMLLCLELNH
ncbi:8137_t:CDS:2 [Entrophospora sp. SA101]|nr:8137_t:CDS:2 [Entrophospora sp. SA101]